MINPKNFWLWFGGIWFVVGAPVFVLGLYFGLQHAAVTQRLDAEGKTVEGMVLTKARKTSSSGSRRSGGSAPTYEVTFRFTTPAGLRTGKAEVSPETWDALTEREPIRILYLPDAPEQYCVEGQSSGWWLPGGMTVMGGMFAGLGGFILLRARTRLQFRQYVQREGLTTTATVSEVRESNVRINGVRQWVVRYEYPDERGTVHEGKEDVSPEEALRWKEGDRVTIRYDRRRPARSVWAGS